jgi:hypothetical protein
VQSAHKSDKSEDSNIEYSDPDYGYKDESVFLQLSSRSQSKKLYTQWRLIVDEQKAHCGPGQIQSWLASTATAAMVNAGPIEEKSQGKNKLDGFRLSALLFLCVTSNDYLCCVGLHIKKKQKMNPSLLASSIIVCITAHPH